MNTTTAYLIQIFSTGLICILLLAYFRPFLKKVLIDLCSTEDRANFWLAFANIVMLGIPILYGIGYISDAKTTENIIFEAVLQIRANLFIFMMSIIGVGMTVCLFAITAPRPQNTVQKEIK